MSAEEKTNIPPTILVIIGITGDLAKRKLIPALLEIEKAGALPKEFRLVGVTRRSMNPEEVIPEGRLSSLFDLHQMDLSDQGAYAKLGEHLTQVEKTFSAPAQRLFYLSLPPQASRPVIDLLGASGLSKGERVKLLLEKPFGVDLASAQEFVESISAHFSEEQVYRIDHYLAKEMAQNVFVFRQGNSLFRRTWNADFIERIDITAEENIGIEGRAAFYEQTGALRDIVQNHLLQLAAITLLELPKGNSLADVPSRRCEALRSLRVAQKDGALLAIRGQYEGYRNEVNNPGSAVETFVSLQLESSDPRWKGVPITLTTGKSLARKGTEIRIRYKQEESFESNELILRIQPDEGVEMSMWAKRPGYDRTLEPHSIRFDYGEHYENLPEAYERVIVDAVRSDHSFFVSSEEILAAWKILEPVQKKWGMSDSDLVIYKRGSSISEI